MSEPNRQPKSSVASTPPNASRFPEGQAGDDGVAWIRPAQQKRSQRVLDAVLDAARELANERAFDEIPVVEICAKAGCSVPAFYRRFADKEALLQALHTRHISEAIETSREVFDPEHWVDASLSEILAGLIDLVARASSKSSGLRITAARRAVDDERFAERIRASRSMVYEGLRRLLLARREELGHADPELATRFLLRMTFGVLARRFDGVDVAEQVHALSHDELVRELTRAAIAYLGLEPAESTEPD